MSRCLCACAADQHVKLGDHRGSCRRCDCPVYRSGADRPAMNETLPCGTSSAKRRHAAKGRTCETCGVGYEPLPTVEPLERVEASAA